jgi:alkylhydroperoxidase family enzyme
LARRLGATPEMIDGVIASDYSVLQEEWRSAMEYADAMTPTGSLPDQRMFERLSATWTEPQIVEITAVIGLFNYFNRFANALDIPPTR